MENPRMRARAVSVTTTDRTGERLPWTSTLKHLPTVSTVFGQALERKATEARQSELVELQSRGRTTEDEVLHRPEVGAGCPDPTGSTSRSRLAFPTQHGSSI